ncbi:VOC family protein [Sphaerochaeta globosa]|uniref:Lactoylglutathione lyase-like protein n=1 Tax=Sphaerochaeta globosa (strain ATCC BAA-1886 / DSM 22777 / Buddy) TaxID=158189 RepID=F0RRI2_SPHGB|nr:VOC family protein [Sphaerochaeta globosa]ADY14234.1 lactoylglutathione lyase-like protein [Sphaerochaeta globosa str. Buddy]
MKDGDICQIAEVVTDIDKAMKHLWEDFGMGPWDIYEYGPTTVRNSMYRGKPNLQRYKLAVCWIGPVQYELMQPIDGYSIYNEFLEKSNGRSGIQHFKIYYKDCKKKIAELKKKGYEVIQSGEIGDDEFYYLSTEEKIGTVIELGNAGSIPAPIRTYPET